MRSAILAVVLSILTGCASAGRSDGAEGVPRPPGGLRPVYVYYPVEGATITDLWTSLRRSGPRGRNGRSSAQARWSLSWKARWAQEARGCVAADIDVEVESEVVMPRWEPAADAPPELVEQWDRFMAALYEHEHGHLSYGVRAARAAEREVRRMRAHSCTALALQVRRTVREIAEEYHAHSAEYDVVTRHGATQGVRWPPASVWGEPVEAAEDSVR